jgi:hypothetical protein
MIKYLILFIFSFLLIGCQPQPTPRPEPTSPTSITSPSENNQQAMSYSFTASESGITAFDLLSQNADITTKDFGDAGQFVDSINGLAGDTGHYWGFYLNGEYATAGVIQTTLKEGDTIEFKYEVIDPNYAEK